MMTSARLALALFILRCSLGFFLLLWSFDKMVEPATTVKIFIHFYGLSISPNMAGWIGVLEALLSLAILAGFRKTVTYGSGLVLHAISTLSTYEQLLSPFGQNHLFIAAIPVMAGFLVLFLLRDLDTLWCVDHPAGLRQNKHIVYVGGRGRR